MNTKTTTCLFNKLFIIESLADDETHTGAALRDEVKPVLGDDVSLATVTGRKGFIDAMARVWGECAGRVSRVYPMLHIDSHGARDAKGILLLPSGDVIAWDDFARMCREINIECHNNLIVTMGLCYGLHAILSTQVTNTVPFLALIGSEEKITIAHVRCFASFYTALLRDGDINAALVHMRSMGGPKSVRNFLAEKLLLEAFAAYIGDDCRGKGRLERAERLLTQYNVTRRAGTRLSLVEMRRIIKQRMRPDAAAFEQFKQRFLMSNHPLNAGRFPSTFEDAVRLADLASAR